MTKATANLPARFRAPRWLAVVCFVGAFVLAGAGFGTYWTEGFSWLEPFGALLSLFCVLGAVDALTTRVELREDSLLVVANLRRRIYPKSSFQKVAWAEGAPPALQLQEGQWLFLPRTLPRGLGPANTLKAWLKR